MCKQRYLPNLEPFCLRVVSRKNWATLYFPCGRLAYQRLHAHSADAVQVFLPLSFPLRPAMGRMELVVEGLTLDPPKVNLKRVLYWLLSQIAGAPLP